MNLEKLAQLTWKQARRVIVIILGTSVLLIGFAMILLPGPALIVIPLGLAILGTEFLWARRILKRMKREGRNLLEAVGLRGKKPKDASDSPRRV